MAKRHWLEGRTVVAVRPMSTAELIHNAWIGEYPPAVLVLDDGTIVYPSRDDEGNGPGAMFAARGETLLQV